MFHRRYRFRKQAKTFSSFNSCHIRHHHKETSWRIRWWRQRPSSNYRQDWFLELRDQRSENWQPLRWFQTQPKVSTKHFLFFDYFVNSQESKIIRKVSALMIGKCFIKLWNFGWKEIIIVIMIIISSSVTGTQCWSIGIGWNSRDFSKMNKSSVLQSVFFLPEEGM